MHRIQRTGGVAALLVAAVLATSACGSSAEDPDSLAVPADTAPASTVSDVPATVVQDEPTTTVVADDATSTASTGIEMPSPFGAAPEDPDFVPVQWLVPWGDGFLAMGVRTSPTALPEQLPPEVAELFPPEVVELFPDGLPPTQQEAIEILEDADLFEVVMDVLDEHPEAFNALTAVAPPDFETVATWSMDGEDWTSLDITPPDGFGAPAHVVVFGDRLTMVDSPAPDSMDRSPVRMSVASTTDLEAWVMDTFEVEVPNTIPESVMVSTHPAAIAANDEGWVVDVATNAFVEVEQFLPESVRELQEGPGTLGIDPEGVTVGRYEDGAVISVERFTWDELDVPDELLPYLRGEGPETTLWGGPWAGQPASTPGDNFPGGMLIATAAGFLDLSEDFTYSPDGITWSAVAPPQPNLWVEAAAPLDGDVMAFTRNAADEVAVYRVDPTGETWTMLDVPEGVDGHANSWSPSSSPAFLLGTYNAGLGPEGVVVQYEGFELTMTYGADRSYQLVDVATGEVVLEESIDLAVTQEPPDGPFENVADDMIGLTFTDPDTGGVIVSIPHSVIGAAFDVPDGGADEVPGPDWWVLATHDGEVWLLADVDEGDGDEPGMPSLVATNGGYTLVGSPWWEPGNAPWQRFPMPG